MWKVESNESTGHGYGNGTGCSNNNGYGQSINRINRISSEPNFMQN